MFLTPQPRVNLLRWCSLLFVFLVSSIFLASCLRSLWYDPVILRLLVPLVVHVITDRRCVDIRWSHCYEFGW
ncbi:uncharacterized protein F5891DRAFT_1065335 [Suillus fuscotomentosus]|uniref:Uncharacterized protein n=1 Tax=Suillus fuscotomentosus TaxID=1912939 RepID=A0AAD4DTL9_9AGAM|nr:uncharacterized protein F5891DRAFT_1065335 [Suillus fuscotomentosus]KAG1893725.1 hypothetical protein F5891DRAFT_1065335 [Suillus fuscotomentosus]